MEQKQEKHLRHKTLLQTNLLVCGIIVIGFLITSLISYQSNLGILEMENDAPAVHSQLRLQLCCNILIIVAIVALVLFVITTVIRRYNVQISDLTISQELEYQRLLHEATEGLYENIYELDVTHNRASGENTRKYFESLGISPDTPYDKALHVICEKQVKAEYMQGYLDTFCSHAVLEAYRNGISNLTYDMMISDGGEKYRWIRISAQIFYWHSDHSVRMITFRKNIDAVKKMELLLLESIQRDAMTGLYNKRATEDLISEALESEKPANKRFHAFLIFDIDNFKAVNDTKGHSFGDTVINEMADELKTQFREYDILGRIGGDEFAVLMKNLDSVDALRQKLTRLCSRIEHKNFGQAQDLVISCSIGVSLFPTNAASYAELYEKADQALYHAKSHGKSSFVFFDESSEDDTLYSNQRDLEVLVNIATDGLAQYACTTPLKLLNFNQKCVDLFGIPAAVLCAPDYDPLTQIHPDDVDEVRTAIQTAAVQRNPFVRVFRVRHHEGHYMTVKLRGIFISALYKGEYPVFYVMYTKQ